MTWLQFLQSISPTINPGIFPGISLRLNLDHTFFYENIQHLFNIQCTYTNTNLSALYPNYKYIVLPQHHTIKNAADALFLDPNLYQTGIYQNYNLIQLKMNISESKIITYKTLGEVITAHVETANVVNYGFMHKQNFENNLAFLNQYHSVSLNPQIIYTDMSFVNQPASGEVIKL